MPRKCSILGMLISLHSLGLILGSLFTYKWYVDINKEIGIFGICEYLNSTTFNNLINEYNISLIRHNQLVHEDYPKKKSFIFSRSFRSNNDSNVTRQLDDQFDFVTYNATFIPIENDPRKVQKRGRNDSYSFLSYDKTYRRCYQLFWADTDEAINYLASNSNFFSNSSYLSKFGFFSFF
jgi:hypothetical protein